MPDEIKTDPAAVPQDIKPQFFKLRAQLLDEGRSNTPLTETDNMWARLKVYASGGENALHAHPNEDHMFIILDGAACFYGPNGEEKVLSRNDGIMLPAGSLYYFQATSEEPLVLLRVGCAANDRENLGARIQRDGSPLPGKSKANKWKAPVYRPGAYYE
ncbi:MAG: cupin domain-containing protein [Alphaproteobacteria bacterium]|nr:cupin domain-containing protein [Alphaproteobacteria bacterium]